MESIKPRKSLFRRILKWTGLTFLFLILLAILIPVLFKNKIIAKVEDELNKTLNAKVKLGEVDLAFISSFPDLRLSMKHFYVANIDSFAGDTLVSAREFIADINLMSVIKGNKYEINSIILDHPRILAHVLKSGRANWDITKPSATPSGDTKTESPSSFKMGLKDFEIKQADIVYNDESSATKAMLDQMDFKMSGDFTATVFDIKSMTEIQELSLVYGGMTYLKKVHTKIKADLGADIPNFKFTFKENEFALNELVLGLDGYWAMPKTDMDMDLKFNSRKTDFRNILSLVPGAYTKDFANVKTTGKLALDGFVKGLYTKTQMPAFGVNLQIDNATFQYPSLPKSASDIFVDLKVNNSDGITDHTKINLKRFHADLGGNSIEAHALVNTPVSDPEIDGALLAQVNLGTLHDVLPLDKKDELNGRITADIKAVGRMSYIDKKEYDKFKASGKLIVLDMMYKTKGLPDVNLKTMYMDFNPQFVELTKFDALIGKSDISAEGKIENLLQYVFKNSLLKGNFTMKSELMDLNEFMTPPATPAQPATPAPAADPNASSVLPVPSNLDFALTATINKLLFENIEMTQVAGLVKVANSTADLSELKMNLMNGSMKISGAYDTKNPNKPHLDFKTISISGFDIQQTVKTFNTVKTLAPVAEHANGKFSASLAFTGDMDNKMSPILNSLNGKGDLKTDHVVVTNFAPLEKVADELKMDQFKKLELSNLTIQYSFTNGRVYVQPFDLKAGTISGKMEGSTGFDQTIDYKMKMEIPTASLPGPAKEALTGAFAKVNALLGTKASLGDKVKVTALLGGTTTKPTVKIVPAGMENSVQNSVKDEVKNVIQDNTAKAKADAKAQADKIMADAQVEAQRIRDEAQKASDAAKKEGYAAADELVKQANNPVAKAIAQKAADKSKGEVDKKAQSIIDDGNKAAQKVLDDARKKSDDLLK